MKRCPQCFRDYTDETLNFCLDDGSRLVDGPVTSPLAATIMFPTLEMPLESSTVPLNSQGALPSGAPANTIAVLPFLNLSRDENGDYFSDGLAEELLNVLAKIKELRVAARTSAFSFKGKQTTVAEIGQILNVASVLEGSIRTAADRVRISVQLVKVQDGYQLWAETYDRKMDDIFAVQDDIARSVVEEIRVRLLGDDSDSLSRQVERDVARAVRGRSDDPEAQRLMLLGRHFLDRTTKGDTEKAIQYFEKALEIDPDFALCWTELARAHSHQAGRGWIPVEEGFNRGRKAVLRALELQPDLAEAHAQLGRIQAVYDWDLIGAEASYRKALELSPYSSPVLDSASILFYKLRRFDEAIELSRRAIEQDPLIASFWDNLGVVCHGGGLLEESEKGYRRAIELAPQRLVSHALLAMVLLDEGEVDEAKIVAANEPDVFWRMWAHAIIHHVTGDDTSSDEVLKTLLSQHTEGNAYQIAEIYAVRGESDEAFRWLERAMAERDSGTTHLMADPNLHTLQSDPRWQEMLSKIGF